MGSWDYRQATSAVCWSINRTVVVCLPTYISFHRTTVVSITLVPSVACQHTEGEYIPTNHFPTY